MYIMTSTIVKTGDENETILTVRKTKKALSLIKADMQSACADRNELFLYKMFDETGQYDSDALNTRIKQPNDFRDQFDWTDIAYKD